MKYILSVIFSLSIFGSLCQGSDIVLTLGDDEEVKEVKKEFRRALKANHRLDEIIKKSGAKLSTQKVGEYAMLTLGPFADEYERLRTYLNLREVVRSAYLPETLIAKQITVPETKVIYERIEVEKEDPTLWTALFGLAVIGIFALYLSSDQVRHMRRRYDEIMQKQEDIEKKQSLLLEKMGERIKDVALKSVAEEKKLLDNLEKVEKNEIKKQLSELKENDETLLETTYEMIDFLKIKSGNVTIYAAPFQLSNLLHKLGNVLAPLMRIESRRLRYDIDLQLGRYIVADTVRVFQVLHSLLHHTIASSLEADVVLEIKKKDDMLSFVIKNSALYLSRDEIDELFVPSSWEELQEGKKLYSFYITKELVGLMEGSLDVRSAEEKGTVYEFSLPFKEDPHAKNGFQALSRRMNQKRILVVDEEKKYIKNALELFEALKMEVGFEDASDFHRFKKNLGCYDIVLLRESDILPKNIRAFEEAKKATGVKLIIQRDMFRDKRLEGNVQKLADALLHRPVIVGDVEEILYSLFPESPKAQSVHCSKAPTSPRNKASAKSYIPERFVLHPLSKGDANALRAFSDVSVLVVEDNDINLKILCSILDSAGISVHCASDGKQALRLLNEGAQVDLILMDMSMPVMDGFEATKKIKDAKPFKDIPIVAVTGLGFPHELERMHFAGVDACIVKPYRMQHLLAAFEKFLSKKKRKSIPQDNVTHRKYSPDAKILNVQKGIKHVRHVKYYDEILKEVQDALLFSDKYIETLVSKRKTKEIQAFCRDTLSLVDTIGATDMGLLMREMLDRFEQLTLEESDRYLERYRRELRLLQYEISAYLSS